ncbi:hypothetical protein QQF64_019461, partial [Cirrhinus molitorella]
MYKADTIVDRGYNFFQRVLNSGSALRVATGGKTDKHPERSKYFYVLFLVHKTCSCRMTEEKEKGSLSEMSLSKRQSVRSDSDVLSSVSVKSDWSKEKPPQFSEETPSSTKSDWSHDPPPDLREETLSSHKRVRYETLDSDFQTRRNQKNFKDNLMLIFQDLESKMIPFLKNELENFRKILQKENIQYVEDFNENRCSMKEAALDFTLCFLREMKQDEAADTLEDELVFIHQLKCSLKKKYQCVSEGIAKHGDSTLLNNIYTDIYITQGSSGHISIEHEVRQIEFTSRHHESQEIQVECTKMFQAPEQHKQIRTVLTKGVAGIGKSISVQKFILDWTEGKENQDIRFIFPLPFRELNLKEKKTQSLISVISQFFPETKRLNLTRRSQFKVLFILDGLDECRLPLNFDGNETLHDVSSPASLDVLLTNLIKGNLLPSALIWITTRPAAASKIPPDCIDRVTEVRGFNDAQKEEYFKKRFTDQNLASEIIGHVKKSKSLFIMCHIPVFCWISATVLQNILEERKKYQADDASKTLQESNTEDIPKTLTQMYTHFLRFQVLQSRRKYDGTYAPDISWDKDAIHSLGKLAFHQLERNNLIFYDTDLEACGIDIYKASVYSGMCTQIFKEETGIFLGTMYCFVHLSIQEFIASLYAHLFLDIRKENVFFHESTEQRNKNETMIDLLKTAVDKALESDNGHLDLFLRFLLGLSLQSNRLLLQGLLTQQDGIDQSKKEVVQYIKQKLEYNLSPERSINLFYCLNELNDQTLVKEIQTHLSKGSLSSADLSPAQWSALAFVLLTSEEEMEVFELQKFKKSDECLIRLSAVTKTSKRALLNDCHLTDKSCPALATILGLDTNLKELNMNNNNLQDSGVNILCIGLKSLHCKLEILRLSHCSITEEGYKALASALRSNPSHLIELDLTGNDPGQSGVKELSDFLLDPNCQLKILKFLSPAADEACQYVSRIVGKNPLFLRELNLSGREIGDLKQLFPLLRDKHCTLNTLILSDCSITEEGYKALASALRSNPSYLVELDLRGNDPGQSGVKQLNDLLQDVSCKLKTIRFLKSPAAQEACDYLTEVLGTSPLLLKELDLSEDKLGDLDGKKLSALLMDSHSKLEKMKLNNCELTEKSCSVLATVLSSKTILKEMDLNNSRLLNSGVKEICEGLKNPVCELKILKLSECSITEEGYKALASALRLNPSHLIELDLTGNDPGQSGVKELSDLLQDTNCQLKTLRFLGPVAGEACQYVTGIVGKNPLLLRELNLSEHELRDTQVNQIAALLQDKHCKLNTLMLCNCGLTEECCSALATVLVTNPSLKELDMSDNNLQDSGVKKLMKGLENTSCTLEKLRLSNCCISEEGYKALASALRSNSSHLIELDLTGNDPGQSGVKELNELLQDPNCQLKILRFLSFAADEACQFLTGVMCENPLLLRELNLSDRELGDTRVNQIAALLQDRHCKLNTLILCGCSITEKQCFILSSALKSNPSHMRELDLSENQIKHTGVNHLCDVLKNSHCKLERLRLSDCSITEEGYKALASALRSNPSHLIELDLTGNDPGQSGVKELNNLVQDDSCKLKTLRFLKSLVAEEACEYLTKVLGKNPLLLKELDLSEDKLGDLDWEKLSALLTDSHSKLEKIKLNNCKLTEKSCSVLATVLSSKTILKEMDLNNSCLLDSGVKEICEGLKNPVCELKILKISNCSIFEEGYKALASALRSNPVHLIELNLTGNDPGQSGVMELNDLLQDPNCQLKTLSFLDPAADEACQYVTRIVGKNPLLLRELNLSEHKLGDTGVNQITALLLDKHCQLNTLMLCDCHLTEESCSVLSTVLISKPSLKKLDMSNNNLQDSGVKKLKKGLENTNCTLQKLKLSNCSITEEGYKALASALRSNPSHLIELDLTGNDPGQSGVKELSDFLQDPNCQLKTLRFLSPAADEACQYVSRIVGKNPLFLRELNLKGRELGNLKQLFPLLRDKHCTLNTLMFLKSPAAQDACNYLTKVLGTSPLLLKELDLSEDKLGDLDGEKLSALLMDSHTKVEKIMLNNCKLTEKSCSILATVLSSKTILKEMDLNNSHLLDSGVKEICEGLKNPLCELKILKLSNCSITEEGYKALASTLRLNPSHLIELDLTGNDPGQSGVKELNDLLQDPNCQLKTLRFLGPAADEACQYVTGIVGKNPLLLSELNLSEHKLGDTQVNQIAALLQDKHCKLNTLMLCDCGLTEECCSALATVLITNASLKELDMSDNNLQDSGVKKLQNGLENTRCTLEKLRLSNCGISEEGYKALASALRSNPSHLIELDLTGNDPGQSGVKELSDLLQDPNCQLKILRFLSFAADEACQFLTGVMCKNPLLLREVNLSECELGDTRVNQIAALLQDKHCKLNTLILCGCSITEKQCFILSSALKSNPSHLRELDLSENQIKHTGVNHLCDVLKNSYCKLERLRLSDCSITEEGYKALASALKSNPSYLIELDLTGNDPGQSGVEQLTNLLEDDSCKLKTIRFLKSLVAEEVCDYLTEVLGKSPLLLKELDLSEDKLGDLDWEKLSALLTDSHSKLEKIKLNNCKLTEKSCSVLATVLSSKTILKEMDLNNSSLLDSGIKEICEGLKNPVCELKILKLSNCSITEEGYKALASALRSNPSHLIELDLTGNDPGQSGVKELSDLLQDPNCHLKTLRFLGPAADEVCQYATGVQGENPLLLRELNLSLHELGDTRVNQIAALLQDKHCILNKLTLWNCSITEKQCFILTSALKFNLSHLKDLDLSGNQIKNTGVNHLCGTLKDSHCKLERLRLSCCYITDEGCSALTSALKSNPSHLKELILSGNELGDSGVKNLGDLLMNPQFKLEKLHLCECSITKKQVLILTSALKSNPSHLRELDLSRNELKHTGVKHLCDILKDVNCKLEKLRLRYCEMTDEGSSALTSALKSNPSHLRELNLSMNELADSGVKNLSDLLMNPQCELEIVDLCGCNITYEQGLILTSALKSNPSHLRELDLSENQIKNTGVNHLCDILKDSHCKLERL